MSRNSKFETAVGPAAMGWIYSQHWRGDRDSVGYASNDLGWIDHSRICTFVFVRCYYLLVLSDPFLLRVLSFEDAFGRRSSVLVSTRRRCISFATR